MLLFMDNLEPKLVENGVKYFLNETLKQCHAFKLSYHNLIFNITLFISFVVGLTLILYFNYKGKLTPIEKQHKERAKHQYILSKIKNLQEAKRRARQELITGLPSWDSPY